MRKPKARTTERYRRWEENAREAGKRRLAVWLPAEVYARLQALAQTHGLTLAQTLAKVTLEHGQAARLPHRLEATAASPSRVGTNVCANVGTNAAGLTPETRDRVLGWRAEGASWAECARRLDEQGIEPPRGGRWLQGRGQTNLARYFKG